MNEAIRKYPRTHHIEGSRKQPGDQQLDSVAFATIRGRTVVVEEKVDGANAGVSFTPQGELKLQSRGHYLTGGGRERHFAMFKRWAAAHRDALWRALGSRYIMYGEWLYAKHTVFYDRLPHFFLEFDLLDTEADEFLDTDRRMAQLCGTPVVSVPVLWRGRAKALAGLESLVGPSLYKSDVWRDALATRVAGQGLDAERTHLQTDLSDSAEGLYIKVEEGGRVSDRYKLVRASFLTVVVDSDSHWLDRPILPNQLAPGADLFCVT